MRDRSLQSGFTLIELLVVILIIFILSAIAIPVFFEQREKAWEAQMQSALKNASLATEAYALDNGGSYAGLNNSEGTILAPYGFQQPDWAQPPDPASQYLQFRNTTATFYCIQARHPRLTASSAWRRSTYRSSDPVPKPMPDSC